MNIEIITYILIPFLGTSLGSLAVFFIKDKVGEKFQDLLMCLASGIMIAASIFSLLIPSIEMADEKFSFLPATVGFILGNIFLLSLKKIVGYIDKKKEEKSINKKRDKSMLFFSVTLHNIPEGMIVGIMFAAVISSNVSVTLMSAIALAIGIAIQNIPEGLVISIPLKLNGMSKKKAFFYGMLSGVVEPIAAIITIFVTRFVTPILPYVLSFAAGTMIYVIFDELIPEKKSNINTICVSVGFIIMMLLDIILG